MSFLSYGYQRKSLGLESNVHVRDSKVTFQTRVTHLPAFEVSKVYTSQRRRRLNTGNSIPIMIIIMCTRICFAVSLRK